MTHVDRRTFLKGVVAASAVAGAPTAFASPTTASQPPNTLPQSEPSLTWNKSPCRLCGIGCGVLVGVQSGRAVSIKGDPASPVASGLACAKGYYSVQAMYGLDRLNRALIRRGSAETPAPIGQALDLVAQRLKDTLSAHGPESVAIYGGAAQWSITDAYVASKLFKGALGSNNVETSARLASAAATGALRSTFGLPYPVGCYDDIDHADVIVLWDVNVAETDPVLFSRMLARRSSNPAVRIIDVTSRTTRTSYAADQTILHPPRATRAIAETIAHDLIERKLIDRRFVERYTAVKRGRSGRDVGTADAALLADDATAASWEEYVASLSSATADHLQTTLGVPVSRVQWLASIFGDRSRKVLSVWGANVNQHVRGLETNAALYNLHLISGRIGSSGNNTLSLSGQAGGAGVLDAGARADALPRGDVTNAADRKRAASVWGVPEARINAKVGKSAVSIFRAVASGQIKFLWVQASNPMASAPNLEQLKKAALGEGCFVVVSDVYRTASTDVADVVLPSAMWSEREGIADNDEHRLQQFDLMVAAPGESMSDTWQMIEVAKRLGHGALFPTARRGHVEKLWEEFRRFYQDAPTTLPEYGALRMAAGIHWPVRNGQSVTWRYNTNTDPSANKARGEFDFYGHPDARAWIIIRPVEAASEAVSSAYPLWLTVGPVLEQSGTGTITQHIPTLHRAIPQSYVEFHKDDAQKLGVHDRDMVTVASKRGSVTLEARIDYRSQPQRGQLFIPSFDAAQPVAKLMPDVACGITGQPELVQCAVRVQRAGGSSAR